MNIDFLILDFIQSHFRNRFLDTVMPLITKLGNGGALWIACCVVLLLRPKTRRAGAAMVAGLVLESVCCNLVLKPLVARVRPCDVNTAVQLLIPRPTDFSFPSGHTGASFAATSALYFSKNKLWVPALLFSLLIAFSRLYLYVHYPSDVLAGVLLGILSGWLGTVFVKAVKKPTLNGNT